MIQFVAFVAASIVFGLCTIHRVHAATLVATVLFALVPVVGSSVVLGPIGDDYHPGAVFSLVVLVVQLVVRPGDYARDAARAPLLVTSLLVFAAIALVTSKYGPMSFGLLVPFNQIVGPLALFALFRRSFADDPRQVSRFAGFVILLSVVEGVIALAVTWGLVEQPWKTQLSSYAFYDETFTRAMGTTDHPLILAGLLVTGVCLVPNLRSGFLQVAALVTLTAGIISTQSRTGLLLALAIVLASIIRGGLPGRARIALASALLVGAVVFFVSPLANQLLSKFGEDGGSADARGDAVSVVLGALPTHVVLGGGAGSSRFLAQEAHLATSLENAFFMYAIDYGVIATLLYVGAMVAVVLSRGRRTLVGGRLAGLAAILTAASFSSIAENDAAGGLLWVALALALVPVPDRLDRSADPAGVGSTREPVPRLTGVAG